MRIAAIRYINTLPLVYGLEKDRSNNIVFETPSRCYRLLAAGEVDIALAPVFGTQTDRSIKAVKGLGIAALNRTESVYLFSRKPPAQIETLAGDEASLTSAALIRIILRGKYRNTSFRFVKAEGASIHDILRRADAALMIGDQAIMAEKTDYDHYDLATEWYSMTRLPFVFAVWACRQPLTEEQKKALNDSYLAAVENMDEIYARAGAMLPVGAEFLERYYNHNLHYRLNRPDYEGLLKFLGLAAEFGVVEEVRKDIWA